MDYFSINVFVYNLRFKTYVKGEKSDYTDEQLKTIEEDYEIQVQEMLDRLGYVS